MSCERCLKAQEMCITSMNRPAPVTLPSNHGQNLLARDDRERQRFDQRHESMSVLHKSSGSRVEKLLHSPSPIPERRNMEEHHYWGEAAAMPNFPGGSFPASSADIRFNIPLGIGNFMAPVEHWGHPHLSLSTDAYNLPCDWMPSNQQYPCEAKSCFSSVFTSIAPTSTRQATEIAIPEPVQTKRLNYDENESLFAIKDLPDPVWEDHRDLATITKPLPITTWQEGLPSTSKLEIQTRSMLIQSSPLFCENSGFSIETLDLPIYRLLDHSSWLLAIVRFSCGATEESLEVLLATQIFESEGGGCEGSSFILPGEGSSFILPDAGENGGDEDLTTASPHDSGYQTTAASPDPATTPTVPKCDIALWLGILEAHCSLVRIYHAVFMRLYQLFLIIPPTDAATILLLPKVRFGQFILEGNLVVQVQSLVDFGSKMMEELDQALKLRSSSAQPQEDRFNPSETVHQKDWSTSIREIVLSQEQEHSEMSLEEIMKCLRQIVKDPVVD
ncbi:hypothetical protein PDIDSM_5295 [Penicillium digitatum]|nr:hypothetical protein PDIDSM_5295 [Penicillium digitatum]